MERVPLKTPRVRLLKTPRVELKPKPKPKSRRPANRKKFTEINVLKLPTKSKQYPVWDSGTGAAIGLQVLVGTSGIKSFRSYYYFPGSPKPHSRTLGRVGAMLLSKARELCNQDYANAKLGLDPKSGDPTRTGTYGNVVEEYIALFQIRKKHNTPAMITDTRNCLLKLSQPHARGKAVPPHPWRVRPIGTIRRSEIQKELEKIRDGYDDVRPREYLANRTYSALRTFFDWCTIEEKLVANPIRGIDRPFDGAKSRTLKWFSGTAADDAIRSLWKAADELNRVEGQFLKMLVLTGKRKTALAEMKWEHIDQNWFWEPPDPGKNKRLHAIPLPVFAQQIIKPRKTEGFVFPGTDGGRLYVDGSVLQSRIKKLSGIDDYIHHGLRHVLKTKFGELEVPPHIKDKILDHRPGGGAGAGYDHHSYRNEMLKALEQWAAHVVKLTTPEGVARLR